MSNGGCPDEADLLPLTTGESANPQVQEHVRDCPACQNRVKQLQGEITALRRLTRGAPRSGMHQVPPAGADAGDPGMTRSGRRPANIGKYFIAGLVDEVGATAIYRALHPTLSKELVIKLGRQWGEQNPQEQKRLVEKGKLLALMEHPHLVRVYDLDFHKNRPFLVMEQVRGPNLRQYAEQAHPTPIQAAALVAKLARALAEVHRRGILHQDINPGHVLMDESGEPRLDFGLAVLRQAWVDEADPTHSALSYMSPEQARGQQEQVTHRSDLFALGGVLYFLLAGKAPFEGKDPFESLDRLRRVAINFGPLRAAGVPRRLEDICTRALEADPAARYTTADKLAEDLERFVRHPSGVPPWVLWAGAAVLAVGGAVGLFFLLR
jgi:serine/threonine protein kinase